MPAVPQKIHTGLVELRTQIGSVYASPSFWERLYLLWTFRHFQSLPKQVLNRHQQQLVDKLCRTAIVSRNRPIARTSIIGTVENVCLLPDCKAEAAAPASKLVEMATKNADVAMPRAVGSEEISVRPNRATYNRIDVGRRFQRQNGKVQYISAPKQNSVQQSESKDSRSASVDSDAKRTPSRNKIGWALVAVLLGILVCFRESWRALPITVPQVAIQPHEPGSASISSTHDAQLQTVEQSIAALRKPATTIAPPPSSRTLSNKHH